MVSTPTRITLMDATYWITQLNLTAHPEGGFYRQTYRSQEHISDSELSVDFEGERLLSTSIYFVLTSDHVSHFHRLKSDEIWYYHAGSPLTIYVIDPCGELKQIKLGLNLMDGEVPQAVVPKGSTFGSAVNEDDGYALVGCMVSPGFDFQDFELFTRTELLDKYPQHAAVIEKLTPETVVSVTP